MFLTRHGGPAIARIPKNASQSISMALSPPIRLTNEEAMEFDVRVMFVRDPFDRMASGFSFFTWLYRNDVGMSPPESAIESYETYVDWALQTDDNHAAPQYDCVITESGVFAPNRLHWLKDIQDVWEDYYPGIMPDKNDFPIRHKTTRLATSGYRQDDIRKHYAKDFELCQQL